MEHKDIFLKAAKLTLSSVQYSEPEIELFTDGCFNSDALENSKNDAEPVRIKYTCAATLSKSGDVIKASYSEPSHDDLTGGSVSLIFKEESPDTVFIERNGQGNSIITLSESTLCEADYDTPYGAFKMRNYTLKLKNGLSPSGGTLIFEYISQFMGLEAQRIKMRIEIKTEKNGLD